MSKTATVCSSHGTITINAETGDVLEFSCDEIRSEYGDLVRFDIQEYCKFWNEGPADNYDILDLGSWDKDGHYDPACPGWRSDCQKMKQQEEA